MPKTPPDAAGAAGLGRILVALIVGQICLHACMTGVRMAAPLQALREGHEAWVVGVLMGLFAAAPIALALAAGRLADRRVLAAREVAAFWSKADASLVDIEVPSKKIAIYGAGFYGSFIATRILKRADVICFVDRNPHLVMKPHMGLPVVLPKDLPAEVETIYAGVNPRAARSILQNIPEWAGRSLELRYLDETK